MRRNSSQYLLYSPSVVAAVGLLSTVGLLGHKVGRWRRFLVGSLRSVNGKVSLGLVDAQSGLGTDCLDLGLGSPQIDLWSLIDLLALRRIVMGLGGLCPGLTSAEVNLRALVGELRFELRDVGSSELVGKLWAILIERCGS